MHNAPSVVYPVGRCAWCDVLFMVLWLAGCGAALLTVSAAGLHWGSWRASVLMLAPLLAGVAAYRTYRALPRQGQLQWDGHDWWWSSAQAQAQAVRLRVQLASQRHLLLCLDGADLHITAQPPRWLCLCAASAPTRWQALRCAVYSRAVGRAPHSAVSP